MANSKTDAISFRRWKPSDQLEKSPLGFWQPSLRSELVEPDVILTPLLGFDADLNRIGQGAGHYDRAFADFPDALRIGIAWSIQQIDQIPLDPWDVPLDAVITEERLFLAAHSRLST